MNSPFAGLTSEGIYRVSSPVSRLDSLEISMDSSLPLHFTDPHEAAGLVKVNRIKIFIM